MTRGRSNGNLASGNARLTSGMTARASARRKGPRTNGVETLSPKRRFGPEAARIEPSCARTAAPQDVGPWTRTPFESAIPPSRSFSIGDQGTVGHGPAARARPDRGLRERGRTRARRHRRARRGGQVDAGRMVPGAQIVGTDEFWDGSRFEIDRLAREVVEPLVRGETAQFSSFDWAARAPGADRTVSPDGIVIVEGVCALHRSLRDAYAVRVWVEAPYDLRLARGVARDGEAARSTWVEMWMPSEERYVERDDPIPSAHLIVDGSANRAGASATPAGRAPRRGARRVATCPPRRRARAHGRRARRPGSPRAPMTT